MAKRTDNPQPIGGFPGIIDNDIDSLYAWTPPTPEMAAQQKEDRTPKTCDVHLQRIADNRKKYYAQFGKEDPLSVPGAPEVSIVSESVYATRYREMLLRACLEKGVMLSWADVIEYTDILVGVTEIPSNIETPEQWLGAARELKKLMTEGVEFTVNMIIVNQNEASQTPKRV